MVSFIKNDGNTATLRVVLGPESRVITSLNGQDRCDLDEFFNVVNTNDDIRHAKLDITYCDNEAQIMAIMTAQQQQNSLINKNREKQKPKEHKEKAEDFVCPVCRSNEGLMDKDGKTHPCLDCLKIDIGRAIKSEYDAKLEKIMSHLA